MRRISGSPIQVSGLSGVTALTAEDFDSCALLANGDDGVLGLQRVRRARQRLAGRLVARRCPVINLSGVTAMAMKTDSASACALLVDGTVQCWGYNGYGELGTGSVDRTS